MPPVGALLSGKIVSYDASGGYGFIRCPEVTAGDVYYNRAAMPSELQSHDRAMLVGREVDFELTVTPDGKARAAVMEMLGEHRRGRDERRKNTPGNRPVRDAGPPPEPLQEEVLEEMRLFLEEKDGAMDYGRFANSFPGVKKSQLTPHFCVVAESDRVGGRWQITLIGAESMTIEERQAREAAEDAAKPPKDRRENQESPDPGRDYPEPELGEPPEPMFEPVFVPSATLRLMGNVARWDERKGYGFIAVDGMNDVFVHKNDLPPEMLDWRGSVQDCEVTFDMEEGPDGKSKARDVHALLRPDGAGGWQLRRA